MAGRNTSVYFPEQTYNKLRQVVGEKISRFVSEAVEEKLEKEQQKKKAALRQRMIAGYQRMAKNENLQKELRALEAAAVKDIFTKLAKKEHESKS